MESNAYVLHIAGDVLRRGPGLNQSQVNNWQH